MCGCFRISRFECCFRRVKRSQIGIHERLLFVGERHIHTCLRRQQLADPSMNSSDEQVYKPPPTVVQNPTPKGVSVSQCWRQGSNLRPQGRRAPALSQLSYADIEGHFGGQCHLLHGSTVRHERRFMLCAPIIMITSDNLHYRLCDFE